MTLRIIMALCVCASFLPAQIVNEPATAGNTQSLFFFGNPVAGGTVTGVVQAGPGAVVTLGVARSTASAMLSTGAFLLIDFSTLVGPLEVRSVNATGVEFFNCPTLPAYTAGTQFALQVAIVPAMGPPSVSNRAQITIQ